MSNNERFNYLINSCKNPEMVYNALMAFATKPNIQQGGCAAFKASFAKEVSAQKEARKNE